MRVSILAGAPREFLTTLEIGPRHFDFHKMAPCKTQVHLMMSDWIGAPSVEPIPKDVSVHYPVLSWQKFNMGPTDRLWVLAFEPGTQKIESLLNIAYYCPLDHPLAREAQYVREQFEKALT